MKVHFFYFFALAVFSLASCGYSKEQEKWRYIVISSLDESQSITVFTIGNDRYVMNGIHEKIPNDGYIHLSLSNVDRLGDGIEVCWSKNTSGWKLQSPDAKILVNKLDTSKFNYYTPKGENGRPDFSQYKQPNCGILYIREMDRKPWGNLKVQYIRPQNNTKLRYPKH